MRPPIPPSKSKMLSALRQTSPVRLAVYLLCAFTVYRLWFATRMELVPDEAYYWLWSKHLAASYRDKGPLVAWAIALSTKVFGDTVFGIRVFAVLLSSGAGALIFVLARRLYDDRVALWALLVALVMPMFAVGALLMTIDPFSVFSWALTALLLWRALHNGRTLDWFWMGLAIGGGFLAKFTNGVQIVCILLLLLWSKEHRAWILGRRMWAWGGAFLLSITPIIWWNVQNGGVHLTALRSRSGVKESFGIHPGEFFRFVGEEFAIISPLFTLGMIAATFVFLWKRHGELRARFLLTQCVPLAGLFLFFSLNKAGKGNWIAPALITGIIMMVVFWREVIARRPVWRWGVGAAFAIAIAMTAVMHGTAFLRLPPERDPLRRAQGWKDFAAHVQRARVEHKAGVLIGSHYDQASMMSFYLPDQPTTYLPPEKFGNSQFSLWPGYELRDDTRALYVTRINSKREDAPPPKALRDQFGKMEVVDDFISLHEGRPMTRFRIYLCTKQ